MCFEILLDNSFQKTWYQKMLIPKTNRKTGWIETRASLLFIVKLFNFTNKNASFFFVQTILYCYYYGCVLEIGSSCKVLFTLYNTTLYFYQESRRQIMGGQTCHDLAVTSYIFISRSILVLQKSSVHSDVISHNKNIHNFGYT